MHCNNCHNEVMYGNFCPVCGARLGGSSCPNCGSLVPHGATNCPTCGRAVYASAYAHAGNALRQRKPNKANNQAGPKRTWWQTLICLICGLIGLAALGVSIYNLLMGNPFVVDVDGSSSQVINIFYNTETGNGMLVESFVFVESFETMINWFTALPDQFAALFSGTDMMPGLTTLFGAYIPHILVVVAYLLSIIVAVIATIVAFVCFLKGLFSKSYFGVTRALGWTLGAHLSIYLACAFGGVGNWISMSSVIMLNILLTGGALALSMVGNVFFAGKRFIKAGSIMKFISNLGVLAGGVVALLFFPLTIVGEPMGNQPLSLLVSHIIANNMEMPNFAYVIAMVVALITFIFALPNYISATSHRFASTFKFDGYEDKSVLKKTITFFISVIVFAVPAILYLVDMGGEISSYLYVFIAGGVISLVSAIINKVFLNKDQR